MKVVSTAKMSQRHQEKLKSMFPHHNFFFFASIKEAEQEVKNTDVLVTYGEDVTPDNICEMRSLKWIQVLSAGMDLMPLSVIGQRGILVTNARGIHKIPMAEYTFGVMLQVARRTNELYKNQRDNNWDRSIRVEELYGKTLGILGVGAIGEEIARRAQVFGMKVIGVTKSGTPKHACDEMYTQKELDKVLPRCDYIVVIVPLTEETRHLIGKEELEMMKESAVLINIARGAVIDEEALSAHLRAGKLKMAVLDVFSEEPLPEASLFWQLENCLVTPHISGRSPLYMERALEIFHHNLAAYDKKAKEEMINVVDCRRGY
ncbi:D-2-hydroxyacid dehydrogenase [Aneurinibacillus thermoaerophilus]|uniref:D-2-hydroxyacid dehydrogenase n=1 Tax=Aneurinibacillus thermoaerophilus TaxID=143495 RepID=A0ABX8YCB8_ANETH|nr:D-2-hydroxyacid dehydrogenase [Aneurinibacillus thermoaerophilus]QYY43358.1 D-2-hydroxyacid dehydrogenase [Aneurinibacillus thermoaerophilus]